MSSPVPPRADLLQVIRGLMLAENMGDVHTQLNVLCDLAGIPRPEGDYLDGWTDDDYRNAGVEPEVDDE